MEQEIREFSTGANRNSDVGKLDYEGYFSPIVLKIYAEYMEFHSHLEDGTQRKSDNWQKGIPQEAYMKSGFRHFMDWWMEHRGYKSREGIDAALCGMIFNAMGYLHELHKDDGKRDTGIDVYNCCVCPVLKKDCKEKDFSSL